jgi:hypothetical protein
VAFRVISVDGSVRRSGQYLVDALKEVKPAPAAQRTAVGVLAANKAQLEVAGYRWNAQVTRAVAKAAESTKADPKQLDTMEHVAKTLDAGLHEQGVCI